MMKRSAFVLLPVLLGLACGEGGPAPVAPEELHLGSAALSAVFSGRVMDVTGKPVVGARVTVNGITRVTGSDGAYAVSVTESKEGYLVDVRKDGYGPVSEFQTAGQLDRNHVLFKGFTRQISATVANEIKDPVSGIFVKLPANSLRTATGAPMGAVTFSIVPHGPETMPGDFTARNATNQTVALETVGAVTVSAVDSQGATLGLTPGATMDVTLPVPASLGGNMPACVLSATCRAAMWRFDPATGRWVEQSASTTFNTQGTSFKIVGQRNSTIIPSDGLGSWNADIEHVQPSCTIIEFVSIPLDCYNPPPTTTPEPGLELGFQQTTSSGSSWSKNARVNSNTPFIVLYNLRANSPLDLSVEFPAGAPSWCAGHLTMTSTPAPFAGYPVFWATGGRTRYTSGAPAATAGYPRDSGGNLIDFADVVSGDHPCSSHVYLHTNP